ncbi:unnamed protein product [Malus baccata var. baccata]
MGHGLLGKINGAGGCSLRVSFITILSISQMTQIVDHGLHAVIVAMCLIVVFVYNTLYRKNYAI